MTSAIPTAEDLHRQADTHYSAGRYEDALASFRDALARAPNNLALLFNIGGTLRLLGRFPEAIAAYDQAIAIDPRFAIAQHNRAPCLLQLGDLRGGLQAFEWRKSCPGFDDPRYRLPRQWAGQS